MAGFGIARRRRRRRLASPVGAALVPVGASFGFVGDGILSAAAAAGTANGCDWFMALMGLRLQPVPAWKLTISGTTIARTVGGNANVWINPTAIDALAAQKPDVAIFGTCGHNDGLKNTDPDSDPTILDDWKDAVDRHIAENPDALLIPVMTAWPSAMASEGAASSFDGGITVFRRVSDLQLAHLSAATATDPRVIAVDCSGVDPAEAGQPSDANRVHPDADGGQAAGQLLFDAISPRVAAATPADIQAMIDAATYPAMGAQLDADRVLAGTGGTATTGMEEGSQIATSKLVSNATGATVSCAMASEGDHNRIVVSLSGTAGSDGNVSVQDKASAVIGATPGQYVMTGFGARIPAGLNRLGSNIGNYGQAMNGVISSSDTISDNPTTTALDTIWATPPLPVYGTATPLAKRSLDLRWTAGMAVAGTLEVYQGFTWIVADRLRHAPVYLGDVKPAGTGLPVIHNNHRLRPSGAISAASGGTVRVEPGLWAPFGLADADFAERRIYKGTVDDMAIGSGTLLATISGATWTHVLAGGATTAGDRIFVEVDADNGVGDTVTARSVTTTTVGA